MKSLHAYFTFAHEQEASDIHLVAGEIPAIRIQGELARLDEKPLEAKQLETAIFGMLSAEQKKRFQAEMELDFSHMEKDIRFRVNLHRSHKGIGLAARLIPQTIPDQKILRLEEPILNFANLHEGLILVVGPTGHGKSTTIASIIEQINQTRKAHIVTVEDPIEFLFEGKEALIEQRELGTDTLSFDAALKHVLRQDPDVIFVGEMRDPETIATVLTAAETGHLVFSTLHTSSAPEAVERIVDVFEGAKQQQVLIQLSTVLKGVVAQQLIPGISGKRVAAREILLNTAAAANLIRQNNISQLMSVIQTGGKSGMVTMEQSLKKLTKDDLIEKEVAEEYINNYRNA